MDREVLHLRDTLVPRYAEMVYYGFWFAPEREALQALIDDAQRDVTGTVRLKLYKGSVTVAGRRSPRSLYRQDVVTFEADSVYRQKDAEGFIRLNALRLRIRALRDQDDPPAVRDRRRAHARGGAGDPARRRDRGRHRRRARLHDYRRRPRRRRAGGRSGRRRRTRPARWAAGRPGPGPDRRRARGRAAARIRSRQLPGRVHAGPRPTGARWSSRRRTAPAALLALAGARRIAVGGFVNAAAVVSWAAAEQGTSSWSAPASGGASAWRTRCARGCSSRGWRPTAAGSRTRRERPALSGSATRTTSTACWSTPRGPRPWSGRGGGDLPLCVALDATGWSRCFETVPWWHRPIA